MGVEELEDHAHPPEEGALGVFAGLGALGALGVEELEGHAHPPEEGALGVFAGLGALGAFAGLGVEELENPAHPPEEEALVFAGFEVRDIEEGRENPVHPPEEEALCERLESPEVKAEERLESPSPDPNDPKVAGFGVREDTDGKVEGPLGGVVFEEGSGG